MKETSCFDILGPIMIGPSSSHTAGAARLGKVALYIAASKFNRVDFILQGSFAKTYKGHGTDKALVAGILGMEPHDENLKYSLDLIKDHDIEINFSEADLDVSHPNSVKFVFHHLDGTTTDIVGSSIGGGNIVIKRIDGYKTSINGNYPTVFIQHTDQTGVISNVSRLLSNAGINIASMKVKRKSRGSQASIILEADNKIPEELVEKLSMLPGVNSVRAIRPVKEEV